MDLMIIIGVLVLILVFLVGAFSARYKTVGADDAMIVTGSFLGNKNVYKDETGGSIKIVRGGGTFVLPIFQQVELISLLSHKLDVSTPNVYTENGVPIKAEGTSIIKVDSSIDGIARAAEQFLGKEDADLRNEAREVLEGHLRAILGTMTVEEIYKNRDRFAQEVQKQAAVDLKKMGLSIVSFTIKDVGDENGYLDALGKPRIAEVKRDAAVAEADAIRDARIRKAKADEEGQKAELLRDTAVAEANKEKELKVAAYKKEQDRAKAEADMSYELQQARSEQEVKQEQMQIKIIERQKQIELEEKEIARREKQYDAEVKKKADADAYAIEKAADASKFKEMREADAKQYRIEAEAKAHAEQKKLDGLAIAEAEKAKGTADAEVIRLRGLAEAEAKEKIAEAFEKFGEAAILDMVVKMLPEYAKEVAAPMANIDKITVIDNGNGSGESDGATRMSNYVTKLMSTMPETLKDVSGFDLNGLLHNYAEKHKNEAMASTPKKLTEAKTKTSSDVKTKGAEK